MIDPTKFTDYNLGDEGLEEYILFCIAVAGKNAKTTARNLDRLLGEIFLKAWCDKWRPFQALQLINQDWLSEKMRSLGFGCYNLKSKGFCEISRSGINLRTCTPQELEMISGIGPKTSRFFILHTRENAQVACLDTHLLKWLNDLGHNVPTSTPQSKKKYTEIERIFLEIARKRRMSPADLDLMVWNHYSGNIPQKELLSA